MTGLVTLPREIHTISFDKDCTMSMFN